MRVLIAHSFYRQPGGEDRYVDDQVDLLSGTEHEVRLYRRDNAELKEGLSTAARMTYSRRVKREVLQELRSFGPDIVHLHNAYPALGPAVHLAAAEEGIPLVMTVHNLRLRCPNGLMYTEGSICRRCAGGLYVQGILHECFPSLKQSAAYAPSLWIHRFLFRLESKVRGFIAPSRFMQRRLIEWGISPERISLVRYVTQIPADVPPLGTNGVYVGRLAAEKGVDTLLRALATAGDPPFRIVGGGPFRETLDRLVTQLGLRNVEFSGLVDQSKVGELIRQSRFVVIPSRWEENAPLVAAEAMALGRPLIVSERGGLPEFVEEGEGIACEAENIDAFAQAITTLAASPQACLQMGSRARQFAEREFSTDAHNTRLKRAYERAAP